MVTVVGIGFTGSRDKPSINQRRAIKGMVMRIIEARRDEHIRYVFAHGDCVGADDYFDNVAADILWQGKAEGVIVVHPPEIDDNRAWCQLKKDGIARKVLADLPYLTRNRNIVDTTNYLIAAPNGPEKIRSGTWSTVRYAKTFPHNRIIVIMPNGMALGTFAGVNNVEI